MNLVSEHTKAKNFKFHGYVRVHVCLYEDGDREKSSTNWGMVFLFALGCVALSLPIVAA